MPGLSWVVCDESVWRTAHNFLQVLSDNLMSYVDPCPMKMHTHKCHI